MMLSEVYTKEFYELIAGGSRQSAYEIVPLVLDLVGCQNVVDVGCGVGTWLRVFRECGVEDVLGVDGAHVDEELLEIPRAQFIHSDLRKPLRIDRQFDLVVSLEVAEHLPAECAETFVESLTSLGPVVLFSAALPYQGGTDHINEQWPDYWARHFTGRGYAVIDPIRRKVWQNPRVEWHYAQNILVYVRRDYLEANPSLKREFELTDPAWLSIVHPQGYVDKARALRNITLRQLLCALPAAVRNTYRNRMNGLRKSGDSSAHGG